MALVGVVTAVLAVVMATSSQAAVPTAPAQTWGVNGRVSAILPLPSGKVVVGGSFTAVVDGAGATQFTATNVALFDPATGRFDPTWRPSVNGSVNALATDGARLFLGGAFTKVGGVNRDKVAALSLSTGALDSAWVGPKFDGPVDVMRLSAGALFVGGNWNTVTAGTTAYAQAKAAKLAASTGAFDTAFRPTANPTPGDVPPSGRVWALLVLGNGNVVLGGDFGDINGAPSTRRIAVVNPVTGVPVKGFASTANNGTSTATILDLATDGTTIYEAVAGGGGACTAVDATTGARRWTWHSNGNGQSVRVVGSTVYCGGHFSGTGSFGGQTRSKIAAVDAGTGTILPWAPVINSALGVWSMGSDATRLYLGGDFTKAGGVSQQHFAMWVDGAAASVPSAPVLGGSAGDGVVHLSWQPPSSDGGSTIQRYKLWRKPASSTSYPNAALATVSTGTTYDDATVTNGTAYTYRVLAVNGVGSGPYSNEFTVTPGTTAQSAPSAPTRLAAAVGGTTVSLTWTAPALAGNPAFTRYDIYRGTTSGQRSLLTSVPVGTTTYSESLPPSGTTYFYAVRAVNTVGSSPDSNEVSTAGSSSGAPTQPTLSATVRAGGVDLSWTAGSGGGAADKWVILRDNVQLTRLTDPAARGYRDTTVVSGTTYTYKVRAVNAAGSSPNSNAVTVTVP
ncbi:fibronectin type III domain-containing protein [Terrabacter sp. BE26]|uniref:fibronectin type III domain-containing protein n=1 Tax=Terrabacter sp. BE26 TaxID=2898152 RepID=UPI0035BE3E57